MHYIETLAFYLESYAACKEDPPGSPALCSRIGTFGIYEDNRYPGYTTDRYRVKT